MTTYKVTISSVLHTSNPAVHATIEAADDEDALKQFYAVDAPLVGYMLALYSPNLDLVGARASIAWPPSRLPQR